MDSIGNERADALAKEAAEYGRKQSPNIPPVSTSNEHLGDQAINQHKHRDADEGMVERITEVQENEAYRPITSLGQITSSLNRRQTSVLTQLRTAHAPINKHLHRIRKNDTPNCPQATCRGITEDVHHLVFTCPRYTHERYHLKRSIGKKAFSSTNLFADKETIPHTLDYLNKIGRFKHIYGDITPD